MQELAAYLNSNQLTLHTYRRDPSVATLNLLTGISIKRPHNVVSPHVRRKVTLHARLPIRHLERRRVAPRLQRELLLDDAGKMLRPALARELRRRRFDQPGMNEVRASANSTG